MNNKKTIIILILILAIGIVGLTIAYFSNSSTITNTFNTNPYGTTVTEEFVSPDNWLPGTKTDKSLTVTNSGQVDEAVRISYTEVWTSKTAKNNNEEGDLPLQQNGNTAALIHFTNTDDWTTVTENGTTYRYYNYKLAPNNTTSELLDYVTFNPAITNSSNCTTNETNGTKTIICNSTGTGYDDATYKLTFTIETVQYDKYKEAWNTNINIAAMKPMTASELALKSNPITVTNYLDGNIHEMYTFEHDATEQTPALTDYRYIGDDPYNYVYFNCDDLNNQNSETCEVWRIIGVFDVERPDPDDNTQTITERRMKLVRGSALPETMAWSTEYQNNWTEASLKIYLNGEYYDNLNSYAKALITESKYYLGSSSGDYTKIYGPNGGLGETYSFGTAEQMYEWERGLIVNSNNSVQWSGKIALIYPSDHYLVYAKGIDNYCFTEPKTCSHSYGTNPTSGWIYNSNKFSNQNDFLNTWLLSVYADLEYSSSNVFNVNMYGEFLNASTGVGPTWTIGIRPTLYLSSNVKITDGDGSINNPYKLSL